MRKVCMGAAALMGLAAVLSAAKIDDKQEVRVWILDKNGKAVDLKNVTGTIEITPTGGSKRSYALERVDAQKAEGKAEGLKEDMKAMFKGDRAPICGQVVELDPYKVELMVVRHDWKKKGDVTPKDEGKGPAWRHDHGGSYFKAEVPMTDLEDTKAKTVHFSADVLLMMAGDKKKAKGFEYPEGFYEQAFDRILDRDLDTLKTEAKVDPEKAKWVSHKIQKTMDALPPLSFKDDKDRQEFEKACMECKEACQRLEKSADSPKDMADAVDKCKAKCKEVRSQAKDAQGALTAD